MTPRPQADHALERRDPIVANRNILPIYERDSMTAKATQLLHGRIPPSSDPLLYTREQVATLLGGISTATIRRMERAGRLRPIRLTGRNTGQVFFKASDVHALVEALTNAS